MNSSFNQLTAPISIINATLCIRLEDLPFDLKRILRVQWKELINCVEDAQLHVIVIDPPNCAKQHVEDFVRSPRWVAA